jgi:hypothetical protein
MISKLLLVSAAASGLAMAQPQTASAGVDVDVDVAFTASPYHSVQYYPDEGYRPYHDYDDDEDDDYDRISCWEGRRIVRRAGYRGVKSIKCYGEVYRYRGWRRGHQWRISVDSDTGRIIRARPVDYY